MNLANTGYAPIIFLILLLSEGLLTFFLSFVVSFYKGFNKQIVFLLSCLVATGLFWYILLVLDNGNIRLYQVFAYSCGLWVGHFLKIKS